MPWGQAIAERLGWELVKRELSSEEAHQVRSLAVEKYDARCWNARR
jgi:hypothetical protein